MNDETKRFPDAVEQVLREAGWYPGRRVDDKTMKPWFAFRWQDGPGYCMMFPAAWRVLREFGGLTLHYPEGPRRQIEALTLNPLDSRLHDAAQYNWIHDQWLLEEWFYPLGCFTYDVNPMAITPRGHVYTLIESTLLWGHTFDEALTNMLLGIRPQEVDFIKREQGIRDIDNVIDAVQRILPAS